MKKTPDIHHQGHTYSGTYQIRGEELVVFHNGVTKTAMLHGANPASFSGQLLYEIVVRDGNGKPN
ncbi:hypothetical protein AZSI13_17430 [Azospira sp. I13]|uniref:hypothetical protein n=1 Tax=Azospira sp. I13 TaxID=1765050 RepID=UPI000D4ACA47|nr:hypothetical protein [Azospira sp. I13]GBG02416.1 hypothetical protein AZSI13_17430 [Azospira sp. I13]